MVYVGFRVNEGVIVLWGDACKACGFAEMAQGQVVTFFVRVWWCGLEVSAHEYGHVFVFSRCFMLEPCLHFDICLLLGFCLQLWHACRTSNDGRAVAWVDYGCLDVVRQVCGCNYCSGFNVNVLACCHDGAS